MQQYHKTKRHRIQRRRRRHDELHSTVNFEQKTDADNILHLQQTLGNQAVMQMMRGNEAGQVQPKPFNTNSFTMASSPQPTDNKGSIQRLTVDNTNWKKSDTAYKSISADGVNLVFFMGSGGKDIVLKGLTNGGAKMQFASQVYDGMVGTPKTRVVQTASKEGKKIISTLKRLIKKGKVTNISQTTINTIQELGILMLMEKKDLSTLQNFSDDLKENREQATGNASGEVLIRKMFYGAFFRDLGRIHAADMFLGNGDRVDPGLGFTQLKNIFIDIDTGGALGMDLDVNAANLESVKNAQIMIRNKKGKTIDGNEYKDWVQFAIDGSMAKRDVLDSNGEVVQDKFGFYLNNEAMATAKLSSLKDEAALDNIMDRIKERLIVNLQDDDVSHNPAARQRLEMLTGNDDPEMQQQAEAKWERARTQFKAGIEQGIAHMAEGMESGRYKEYFDNATDEQGEDSGFDYKALQIRHMYLKMKDEHPNMAESRLRELLVEYARFIDTGEGQNPFENLPVWQSASPRRWIRGQVPN